MKSRIKSVAVAMMSLGFTLPCIASGTTQPLIDISDRKDLSPFVEKMVIVRGEVTNTKCPYINGIDMWDLHDQRGKMVEATGRLKSWQVTKADIRKTESEIGTFAHRGPGTFYALTDMKFKVITAKNKATTKGIIDIKNNRRPANAVQLVGEKSYDLIPESDAKCRWVFKDGVLTASPSWDSVITKKPYRDFRMHVEFNVNNSPDPNPEKNGNSGVYIQQRYEIQILNSHGVSKEDYKKSYCGSLYKMKLPDRIVCKPAGVWQTYDIAFRAARYEGDKKIENARITVYHNGQLIHDDVSLKNKTGAGKKEGPDPRPIKLQGHSNPVKFRNVWVQALDLD